MSGCSPVQMPQQLAGCGRWWPGSGERDWSRGRSPSGRTCVLAKALRILTCLPGVVHGPLRLPFLPGKDTYAIRGRVPRKTSPACHADHPASHRFYSSMRPSPRPMGCGGRRRPWSSRAGRRGIGTRRRRVRRLRRRSRHDTRLRDPPGPRRVPAPGGPTDRAMTRARTACSPWTSDSGGSGRAGRAGLNVNVPFSHPSEVYPQKDGCDVSGDR